MKPEQAINILIEAAKLGNYNLDSAQAVLEAIKVVKSINFSPEEKKIN